MVSPSVVSLPVALRRAVVPPGVLPREALRRAMPLVAFPEALPLVGRLLVVAPPGDVLFQGSQPLGPWFSAPNPQARQVR